MDRLPQAALLLAVATVAASASIAAWSPDARANGLATHTWITLRARSLVKDGPLKDFVNDPALADALVGGTIFPDGGYAVGHAYGELAHWEPLQLAYLEWIRARYSPPYTGEGAKHAAFFLGMLSHGMADQVFDSLYMARARVYDAGSDWEQYSMDEATDVAYAARVGPQPIGIPFYSAPAFIETLMTHNSIAVDEATLARGKDLAGFAVVIVGMLGMDSKAVRDYQKQFPWATTHLEDETIPGRPSEEAEVVARYWEKGWALLHGENYAPLFLGTVPREGAYGHARDAASIESRVSVIFSTRQRAEEVTADRFRVVAASGTEVPLSVDLFYGTDSHVVHLIPGADFAADEDYEVFADGAKVFGFSTRVPPANPDVEEKSSGCSCVAVAGGPDILSFWAAFGLLSALGLLYGATLLVRRCPQLADVKLDPARAVWPQLSVIIPACNEAETLEAAMGSLLANDYPNLQIILIDDRSTDGTGAIVDRLSARDPRVVAVHVAHLPPRWLGKVHALDEGMKHATGDYVLFTDADIHFSPDCLRRSIVRMEQNALDHLAIFPTVICRSFLVGTCIGSACRAILTLARPWESMDPKSKKAMGIGAFNLVRRSAFAKTPGFEWLRMEVADDIGVGVMMKQSGAKMGIDLGRDHLAVEWYPTFRSVVRGLEKNGFAQAARFRVWRGVAMALLAAVAATAPFAGFIPGAPELAFALSLAALGGYFAACVVIQYGVGGNFFYTLFSMPLGDLLMAFVVLRAVWLGKKRGGLIWRGTVYPTAALEEGRRVDF